MFNGKMRLRNVATGGYLCPSLRWNTLVCSISSSLHLQVAKSLWVYFRVYFRVYFLYGCMSIGRWRGSYSGAPPGGAPRRSSTPSPRSAPSRSTRLRARCVYIYIYIYIYIPRRSSTPSPRSAPSRSIRLKARCNISHTPSTCPSVSNTHHADPRVSQHPSC